VAYKTLKTGSGTAILLRATTAKPTTPAMCVNVSGTNYWGTLATYSAGSGTGIKVNSGGTSYNLIN